MHSPGEHKPPEPLAADGAADDALLAYIYEGMALLGECVPASTIEAAGLAMGRDEGPLSAADRISLKIIDAALHAELDHSTSHDHAHDHHHSHGHAHGAKSRRMPESAVYVLEKMAHGFKRLGKAEGSGFYDYIDGEAVLWSGLSVFARGARRADPGDTEDRLRYAPLIALLRQPVPTGAAEASDSKARAAWAAIDVIGREQFKARAGALAERYGDRFLPPVSLG